MKAGAIHPLCHLFKAIVKLNVKQNMLQITNAVHDMSDIRTKNDSVKADRSRHGTLLTSTISEENSSIPNRNNFV
jgi:hypothetical protein